MECQSCAAANDAGRRYCGACGGRLGQPCGVCQFFNAFADRHCGGCGRRLVPAAGSALAEVTAGTAYMPAVVDDLGFDAGAHAAPASSSGGGVSPSEIDGLFESILDEDAGEGGA